MLVAIRIATYGENLDLDVNIPNTDITKTYTTDLRVVLGKLLDAVFDPEIVISNEMTVFIRPLTYMEFTRNAIKTMEEQRIFNIVNDESLPEEEKINQFNKSFKKLTDITIGMVSQCIAKIVTPDAQVTDQKFIAEFIENADKEFFSKIMKHLEEQRNRFQIPSFPVTTTNEERQEGAPDSFEVPVTLDASNFFV